MKVILGTDGSRYAQAAAEFAGRWMDLSDATVDLVAISPKVQPDRGGHSPAQSPESEWRSRAGRWMEATSSALEGRGVDLQPEREVGAIASESFLEHIRDGLYDLAVVGAKGRGETPHFAGRSVAAAALERAPVDLLVVRAPDPDRGTRKLGSEMEPMRVLVPTDGGPHSALAVRQFLDRFRIPSVRARVVTVPDLPADFDQRDRAERRSLRDAEDERVQVRLQRAEEWFEDAGIPVESGVREGDPAEAVLREAREWSPHLLLLGSRGFEAPSSAEESVAVAIAEGAPCTVYLVRGDGERTEGR